MDEDAITIEPPYLFEPYSNQKSEYSFIHGKPVVPIGDCIYNGFIKCGNGLPAHLSHLQFILQTFVKHLT